MLLHSSRAMVMYLLVVVVMFVSSHLTMKRSLAGVYCCYCVQFSRIHSSASRILDMGRSGRKAAP